MSYKKQKSWPAKRTFPLGHHQNRVCGCITWKEQN